MNATFFALTSCVTNNPPYERDCRYLMPVKYSIVKDLDCLSNRLSGQAQRVVDMVGLGGIEPPTSPLSGVRSSHLSYRPKQRKSWWSWSGSNRRPPECKSGALPAELQPHFWNRAQRHQTPVRSSEAPNRSLTLPARFPAWWAWVDSNYRPHPYQGCALAT